MVVTVVPLARVARSHTEVVEVAGSARGMVLVISRARVRSRLVTSPAGLVAVLEIGVRSVRVGIVACGENCTLDILEQGGCILITRVGASGYISRTNQNRSAEDVCVKSTGKNAYAYSKCGCPRHSRSN